MSAHISNSLLPMILPGGILVASFLGSAHCVAMCGGLVVNFAQNRKSLALYHLGRLLSYSTLGALAGAFGSLLLANSITPAASWVSSIVFAVLLIAVGIRRFQGSVPQIKIPRGLSRLLSRAMGSTMRQPASWVSPLSLGFLSALLPCGWLYSFVVAAGATQSSSLGGGSLALFWLGTVPALSALPSLVNRASSKLKLSAPKISGAIMICLGLFSLSLHAASLFGTSHQNAPVKTKATSQSCPLHRL